MEGLDPDVGARFRAHLLEKLEEALLSDTAEEANGEYLREVLGIMSDVDLIVFTAIFSQWYIQTMEEEGKLIRVRPSQPPIIRRSRRKKGDIIRNDRTYPNY